MTTKGFAETDTNIETPNDISVAEKPLKSERSTSNRVDINVLKSKLEAKESKEFKKNVYILSTLVAGLGALGVYLSLWENLQITKFRVLIELWEVEQKA